jgi:type I restriction enzyme S subunit
VLHELLTAGGEDWVETTLGEVSEVIGGGTPSTSVPEYWDGEIVWLTPTEITSQDGKFVSNSIRKISESGLKNSGAQVLPKGSVILTSRASVGFVAISAIELCTNQGFQSLVPNDSVLAEFLMFWIQQNRIEFESRSAGSTFKEISKSNVKSIKLSLPPLPEQRRIIEIISYIDELKGKIEKTINEAKRLRSSLLSELLSGEHEIPASYDKIIGAA